MKNVRISVKKSPCYVRDTFQTWVFLSLSLSVRVEVYRGTGADPLRCSVAAYSSFPLKLRTLYLRLLLKKRKEVRCESLRILTSFLCMCLRLLHSTVCSYSCFKKISNYYQLVLELRLSESPAYYLVVVVNSLGITVALKGKGTNNRVKNRERGIYICTQ